LTETYNTS